MKRIESRTIHAGWSKTGQGMMPLKAYIKPCWCGNTRHYTRKHRLFWSQATHAHVPPWGACSFVSFLEFCRASCRACALDVRSYDLSPWSCAQSAASEVGGRPSITPDSRESPPPIFSLTCCCGTAVWRLPFAKEWTTSAAEETHQAFGLVTCKLPQCSCGWQGKLGISARIYAQSIQAGAASSARRLFFQRLDISGEVFTTWMISLIEKTKRPRVAMRASAISHKSVQEPYGHQVATKRNSPPSLHGRDPRQRGYWRKLLAWGQWRGALEACHLTPLCSTPASRKPGWTSLDSWGQKPNDDAGIKSCAPL